MSSRFLEEHWQPVVGLLKEASDQVLEGES
jgi:hypothetical protein